MYDSSNEIYSTSTSTSMDPGTTAAIFAAVGIVSVIIYVVAAIFLSMVYKKAGVERWKAWVPVYNQWVFLELGGQKGWLALLSLLAFIPFIGLVAIVPAIFAIIAAHKIGRSFGKDDVFVILYVFLPLVWIIWLAFDKKAIWQAPQSSTPSQASQSPANGPTL